MPALRHARLLLLLIALLGASTTAACRDRDDGPPPPRTNTRAIAKRPIPAVPTPGDIVVEVQETFPGTSGLVSREIPLRVDAANLARLLPDRPGLPAPFDRVELGEPDRVPRKQLPAEAFVAWEPPLFPGMVVGLTTAYTSSIDGKTSYALVTEAYVLLPRASARALLAAQWGPPTVTTTTDVVWVNEVDGFQARLADSDKDARLSTLEILPYRSLARLIGDEKVKFGFENIPYLDLPVDKAAGLIPEAMRPRMAMRTDKGGSIALTLPSLELSDAATEARLVFEDGRVTRVSLILPWSEELRGRVGVAVARKGPQFSIEGRRGDSILVHEQLLGAAPAEDVPIEIVRKQCERVIDAFWRSAAPALPLLKLDGRKDLEQEYKESSAADRLRDSCTRLTAWTRDCLATSSTAIADVEKCGADPFDFRPVDLVDFSEIVKYRKLDAAEQKSKLAELVGLWVGDEHTLRLEFDSGGHVDTSFTLYKANRFRVELDHDGLVALYNGKQFADVFTYALEDRDTLRFCVNTGFYRHAPRTGGEDSWVTKVDGDILFYDQGRCTTVTEYGQVVPSQCAVAEEEGRRYLTLSVPSAYWPRKDAKFLLLPGRLVDVGCPVFRRTR